MSRVNGLGQSVEFDEETKRWVPVKENALQPAGEVVQTDDEPEEPHEADESSEEDDSPLESLDSSWDE